MSRGKIIIDKASYLFIEKAPSILDAHASICEATYVLVFCEILSLHKLQ